MAKFQKGKSGNAKGGKDREARASLKKAFVKLVNSKPWLVQEAMERGLTSSRPLGFLELGARLLKEIGGVEEQATQVAIVFNSPLDTSKLKGSGTAVRVIEATSHPQLPEANMELLEDEPLGPVS